MASQPRPSPWGAVPAPDTSTSLCDVMSEQLADHLDQDNSDSGRPKGDVCAEECDQDVALAAAIAASLGETSSNSECNDDLMIAQMLQMQFDNEHDSMVAGEERVHNRGSKISVSYQKYKVVPDNKVWQDSDDEDKEFAEYLAMDDSMRDWDHYEVADKRNGQMPRCGYKKTEGGIITKHDQELNHRSNGKKIMSIPTDIRTGDGGGFDMQLSNKVYNQLMKFSMKEDRRRDGKVHDREEKSTAELAVDPSTKLIVYKMLNNGILDTVNGIISSGKESIIIHAEGGPGPDTDMIKPKEGLEPMNVPKECILKVFKTTLNEFKTRDKYIKDDFRFRNRFCKQNPRRIVHMWAEKEMRNLVKMAKHGIHVPEAVVLKNHVLLMSFIGHDGIPAPKLRDVDFSENYEDLELAYNQVVDMMTKLYQKCHLVHADLSEYNILWQDDQAWFIDVSQSVEPNHPSGLEFLYRDCTNVADFFRQRGLVGGKSPWKLFTDITGLPLGAEDNESDDCLASEAEIQARIMELEKGQDLMLGQSSKFGDRYHDEADEEGATSLKDDPFDYCWDKAQGSKSAPVSIPGHAKPKGGAKGSYGKSPKAAKTVMMAKSPKSPMSGGVSLASMTNERLQELKSEVTKSLEEKTVSKQQVKFEDEVS